MPVARAYCIMRGQSATTTSEAYLFASGSQSLRTCCVSLVSCLAAFFEDVIVGSVCCRVDTDEATGEKKLYIMTLGCLAPYRRLGVGKSHRRPVLYFVLHGVGSHHTAIGSVLEHQLSFAARRFARHNHAGAHPQRGCEGLFAGMHLSVRSYHGCL